VVFYSKIVEVKLFVCGMEPVNWLPF